MRHVSNENSATCSGDVSPIWTFVRACFIFLWFGLLGLVGCKTGVPKNATDVMFVTLWPIAVAGCAAIALTLFMAQTPAGASLQHWIVARPGAPIWSSAVSVGADHRRAHPEFRSECGGPKKCRLSFPDRVAECQSTLT